MIILTMIILLTTHYISDFILQNEKMRVLKYNSWAELLKHCTIIFAGMSFGYFLSMIIKAVVDNIHTLNNSDPREVVVVMIILLIGSIVLSFFNAISHLIIDRITSFYTTEDNLRFKKYKFFNTIGIDQILHIFIIFISAEIINAF